MLVLIARLIFSFALFVPGIAFGQSVAVEKPIPKPSGSLIEIVSEKPCSWVAVEPMDLDFRIYESNTVFVTTAQSKTGIVRVLQFTPGEDVATPTIKWHIFSVGPPPSPQPVVLPTAKLTATPSVLDSKSPGPVHLEWTTEPPEAKVTLNDGTGPKVVANNGNAVVLRQPITTLYTLAVEVEGSVVYSQAIVTVTDTPPPPVVDTKSLVSIVYESSEMPVPRQVHNARFELEAKGYECRVVDADVVTGLGTVPVHMRVAIEAARSQGLPALIVTNGDKVLRKMALPATDVEIVKAVTQ